MKLTRQSSDEWTNLNVGAKLTCELIDLDRHDIPKANIHPTQGRYPTRRPFGVLAPVLLHKENQGAYRSRQRDMKRPVFM